MVAIRRFPARCGVAAPTALPLVVLRLLRLVVAGCAAGAPSTAFATNQPAVATVTPLPTAPVAGPVTIRVFELHNLGSPHHILSISQPIPSPGSWRPDFNIDGNFQHRD
jgi:hypothetical protein